MSTHHTPPKRAFAGALALVALAAVAVASEPEPSGDRRTRGLLIGSIVGDALGGPVEFAKRETIGDRLPGYRDRPEARVGAGELRRLADTLPLLAYGSLRPLAEPYGQWTKTARAGTVTDDTRHKMVLLDALRTDGALSRSGLSAAYLRFASRPKLAENENAGWLQLSDEAFREFVLAARWELGDRHRGRALPASRMWGGLGTCCGQMTLPPLAALYPGRPEAAYLAAYDLAFFDNGEAKDLNAAVIAGMAYALGEPIPAADAPSRHAAWRVMLDSMRQTDPLLYGEVPFVERALSRAIAKGCEIADRAEGSPGRLYRLIDGACPHDHAWEAKFLLVETIALADFCRGEPLAAVHLALDYGEDTDSAAQLLGAWFGALYGPDLFPAEMQRVVQQRLRADYDESVDEWVGVLEEARLGLSEKLGASEPRGGAVPRSR